MAEHIGGVTGRANRIGGDDHPRRTRARELRGIVIANGSPPSGEVPEHPTLAAFIWGGKVRPTPPLPYGRFRGAA
jgi:hypothetical protein